VKILWDFRLFSHGYGTRGVGRYVAAVALNLGSHLEPDELYVWGDRSCVPAALQMSNMTWIDYHNGSWKKSVVALPALVIRYGIDLVHYWIALGPLHAVGLSPLLPCASVATVYDAGVELWDVPYCCFVRSTLYWRMQKLFFRKVNGVITISESTRCALEQVVPLPAGCTEVVYPPLGGTVDEPVTQTARQPRFVTLAGSPHKNCRRVVDAFSCFKEEYPEFTLTILGAIDRVAESLEYLPEGVNHHPSMDAYAEMLSTSAALVYCSLYEGLGVPPLEAMQYGTPLVLSSIPPLIETCHHAARFVDPYSTQSIAQGMKDVALRQAYWSAHSRQGAFTYDKRTVDGAEKCIGLYRRLLHKKRKYSGKRVFTCHGSR